MAHPGDETGFPGTDWLGAPRYAPAVKAQIDELSRLLPPLTGKPDLEAFWRETRLQADRVPLRPVREECDYPGFLADVYDISYCGFDETRIHGWLLLPKARPRGAVLPCLIHYHGFTGDRGRPADFLQWVALGVAVVSVDCRDQGGRTGNLAAYTSGHTGNVVCRGIQHKEEYYFRAVYMDCVKAIDFAIAQAEVDPFRIVLEGGSQGGALGMAVSALDARPWLAMVDVPSNSHLERRVIGAHGSFSSVTEYVRQHPWQLDNVLDTLSYFDTMNLAAWIRCPVLASVGLKDAVCPADCYHATYNRILPEKEIRYYPFNGHEGGGALHNEVKLRWLWERLRAYGN